MLINLIKCVLFNFQLGGVINRPDFACHLNNEGEYTMSKIFDYPSLAEVSRLLQSRKVNLIFAVTEDRRQEYERIADLLEEKARVATLAANSANILEIIEKAYHEIVTRVVLRDNSIPELNIQYYSNCGKEGTKEIPTNECDELVEGKVYEFRVEFSLNECPQNRSLWVRRRNLISMIKEFKVLYETSFFCRNKESSLAMHSLPRFRSPR